MSDKSFHATLQEIENAIMMVLISKDGILLKQNQIYSNVVDKLDINTNFIHYTFKYKFLFVLRNLMSKYDDVKVINENNIFSAIYNSNKDADKNSYTIDLNEVPINLDSSDLDAYIIDNDITEEFNFIDPNNNNTIYHNIVSNNNYFQIKKLINDNKFNFTVKNIDNKTPIDLINNQQISNLFIKELFNKISSLEKDIEIIKNCDVRDSINELSFYQFTKIKLTKFTSNYKYHIVILLIAIFIIQFYNYI